MESPWSALGTGMIGRERETTEIFNFLWFVDVIGPHNRPKSPFCSTVLVP